MKYHAFFVILKKQQNFKLSSAANCRWRFKGEVFVFACYLLSVDNLCKPFGNQAKIYVLDPNCMTLMVFLKEIKKKK